MRQRRRRKQSKLARLLTRQRQLQTPCRKLPRRHLKRPCQHLLKSRLPLKSHLILQLPAALRNWPSFRKSKLRKRAAANRKLRNTLRSPRAAPLKPSRLIARAPPHLAMLPMTPLRAVADRQKKFRRAAHPHPGAMVQDVGNPAR